MKKMLMSLALMFSALCCATAHASDRATEAEAQAMLTKAVAALKANGREKAFAQFQDKQGGFIDRDLYVTVMDLTGRTLAHGVNPRQVGRDVLNLQDADGRFIVQERLEVAKSRGKGSSTFKFLNPVTKEIETKVMFFEKVDDLVVSCGAYKAQ